MSNKSPVFPISDPQHFSDYGFDPQINYFQVLEEAMKHKHETASAARSIDSIHFKLQKPSSKDNDSRTKHHNTTKSKKKQRWWKSALFFFKWKRPRHHQHHHHHHHHHHYHHDQNDDVHEARARAFRATSISGPVYLTESRRSSSSGSITPYRTTSRPSSGPLAGSLTPLSKGELDIPYLSLRDLTMEQQLQQQQRLSTSSSAMPIYLVT